MTIFDHLRTTPWEPTFNWLPTIEESANRINVWHEDYPLRVAPTAIRIKRIGKQLQKGHILNYRVESSLLMRLHRSLWLESWAGRWREGRVQVGAHIPPPPEELNDLMAELERRSAPNNMIDLLDWYRGFETIHPFQDGNGRVGGIVVAVYSHYLHPDKGWLGPNQ